MTTSMERLLYDALKQAEKSLISLRQQKAATRQDKAALMLASLAVAAYDEREAATAAASNVSKNLNLPACDTGD